MERNLFTRFSVLGLLLLTGPLLFSQDILWEKSYGGKQADYLFDVVPTPDYGFILVGSSQSKPAGSKTEANRGNLDYWVWKMDEKGEADWQKTLGGNGQDKLRSVVLTYDGGYLLAGSSESGEGLDKKSGSRGQSDFWVVKLNAQGNEEWQQTIGGAGQDELSVAVKCKDGGYLLGGSSSSAPSGDKTQDHYGGMDYWIVKIDNKGKIEWQKSFGGKYNDELKSIIQTAEGDFLLGGSSNSPNTGTKRQANIGKADYWVIMIDKNGEEQWQKTIGGEGDDQLYAIAKTTDDHYLLGGSSNSDGGGNKRGGTEDGTDFWVVQIDKDGIIGWQENYNIGKVDVLSSLVVNDDNTVLIGGYVQGEIAKKKAVAGKQKAGRNKKQEARGKKTETQGKNEEPKLKKGTADYVAIKIDAKGEEVWRKDVGSEGEDILKKVIETRDGGYLMAGTSKGKISDDRNSGIGSNDFWVVKLKDKQKPKEKKNAIEAIPNPATDYTNVIVGYDFEKGTATLVDLAGHILQQFEITSRTVPIDLQGLPDGVYVVNIRTDKGNDGVKIMKQWKK